MSVLITGAGGGLGREVCRVFTEAGLQVVAVDRAWKEVHPYRTIDADLSTAEGAAAMVEQTLAHGPIDALIHLVGGFSGGKSIAETDDKTWDLMMNVNLRVAVNAIRAEVHVHHQVPSLVVGLGDGFASAKPAYQVNQRVNRPVSQRLLDHCSCALRRAQIGIDGSIRMNFFPSAV